MPNSAWAETSTSITLSPTTTTVNAGSSTENVNYLTNSDKILLMQQYNAELATQAQLDSTAKGLGVPSTNYDNAVANINTTLVNAGAPSNWASIWPDGTTSGPWPGIQNSLASDWTGIATARTTLQNDISATQASTQAAAAQSAAVAAAATDATNKMNDAITTAENAAPTVVNGLPTMPNSAYPSGRMVWDTTTNQMYVSAGSSWTSLAVPAPNITGTLAAAQIASVAASQVTGQLTGEQIAAQTISEANLVVTSIGAALNPDPNCSDITGWVPTSGTVSIVNVTDNAPGQVGLTALNLAGQSEVRSLSAIPVSQGKSYRVTLLARTTSGSNTAYFRFFQYGGNVACPRTGSYPSNYLSYSLGLEGVAPPSEWTRYIATVPLNSGATWGMLEVETYGGGTLQIQDFRIEEQVPSSLIVDGTITAAQIAAGTITTSQIAAGTIEASNIAAATITGGNIAANTIETGNIAAGAITANQIASGTITAGQIAAGAIGADQIAANSITASRLTITDLSNLCANGTGATGTDGWTGGVSASVNGGQYGIETGGFALLTSNRDSYFGQPIAVNPGETFAFSVLCCPGAYYSGLGSAPQGPFTVGFFLATDASYSSVTWAAIPDAPVNQAGWQTITGQITIPAGYTRAQIWAQIYATSNATGEWAFRNLIVRKAASAELLVDGSITSATIATGAITADMITTGTLNAAQVNVTNLDASNITAGTLSATMVLFPDGSELSTANRISTVQAVPSGTASSSSANPLVAIPGLSFSVTTASTSDVYNVFTNLVADNSNPGAAAGTLYLYVDGTSAASTGVCFALPTATSADFAFLCVTGLSAGTHTLSLYFELPGATVQTTTQTTLQRIY